MMEPEPFGWFHLLWIFLTIACVYVLSKTHKDSDKRLRVILFVYGSIALLLETIKQIIWTFTYDPATDVFLVDYQWYAAPFQLCSTPMYVALLCSFIKDGRLHQSLLSYMSLVTIIGGIATILMPESCFTSTIEINIHTMWLHCGGLVLSLYLLINKIVLPTKENYLQAIKTFFFFVAIALVLNVVVYRSDILNGETFNMFYISPYFISELPIFNMIQENTPYVIFLFAYLCAISLGSAIICHVMHFLHDRKVIISDMSLEKQTIEL